MKNFIFFVFAFGLGITSSQAAVWPTTRAWSQDEELAFQKFIEKVPADFFERRDHDFGNLPTDCADAAYSLRAIFAFQRGLPVAFQGGTQLVTNETTAFDSTPEGPQRVRKFLYLLNRETTTKTLFQDTYPIAINRKSVIPGTLFVRSPSLRAGVTETYTSGHAYMIRAVPEHGKVQLMSSTVPQEVRTMNIINGLTFTPLNTNGGFRAWKWPSANGGMTHGKHSLEQFHMAGWFENSMNNDTVWFGWQREAERRLSSREISAAEDFKLEADNVTNMMNARIKAVNNGWSAYQRRYLSAGKVCMNHGDYDTYSTQSRDDAIQSEMQYLEMAARKLVRRDGGYQSEEEKIRNLFAKYKFEVMPGVRIDFNQVKFAFLTNAKGVALLSEPEHAPEVRWGLRGMSIREIPCLSNVKKSTAAKYLGL